MHDLRLFHIKCFKQPCARTLLIHLFIWNAI